MSRESYGLKEAEFARFRALNGNLLDSVFLRFAGLVTDLGEAK